MNATLDLRREELDRLDQARAAQATTVTPVRFDKPAGQSHRLPPERAG